MKGKLYLPNLIPFYDQMAEVDLHEGRPMYVNCTDFSKAFDTASQTCSQTEEEQIKYMGGGVGCWQMNCCVQRLRSAAQHPAGGQWCTPGYCFTPSVMAWMMGQRAPSASLQPIQNWLEWLMHQKAALPFRWTLKVGKCTSSASTKGNEKSCTWEGNPHAPERIEADQL